MILWLSLFLGFSDGLGVVVCAHLSSLPHQISEARYRPAGSLPLSPRKSVQLEESVNSAPLPPALKIRCRHAKTTMMMLERTKTYLRDVVGVDEFWKPAMMGEFKGWPWDR